MEIVKNSIDQWKTVNSLEKYELSETFQNKKSLKVKQQQRKAQSSTSIQIAKNGGDQ